MNNEELTAVIAESNKELQDQIERMKCCGNCASYTRYKLDGGIMFCYFCYSGKTIPVDEIKSSARWRIELKMKDPWDVCENWTERKSDD